ncbi:hypothetical protein [Streptomyces sp. NBC_01794]|uniref:phage fiber-tail adaptor protein n=1 Tax=Streptomyces sp. NBC_01794 TaxID=2975942 RepID=UPI00308B0CE5|nr:hypothetical protein OIE54_11915 [Streptomyces sp. NBC_01794]
MADSYIKDPAARLDYTWDWSAWLDEITDTISSATVTVPAGLTAVGAPDVTTTAVTQRISGGTVDEAYTVVCQITTAGGLIDERSIHLTISNR